MANVIPFFVLSILSTIFIALLIGTEYQAQDAPEAGDAPQERGGLFGALDVVWTILQRIWQAVTFIFNAISFNVPGAPWYVRAAIATLITAPIIWGIAILVRGGGES